MTEKTARKIVCDVARQFAHNLKAAARVERAIKVVESHQCPLRFPKFYYEWDSYGGYYRWWCDRNPGDMFDTVTEDEMSARRTVLISAGMEVIHGLPE